MNDPDKPARIWLLLGDKVGDNRQVERVAEALGERCETRRLRFLARWQDGKPPFIPALYHVDRDGSDELVAPWPDLILTIGRRPAMAALWIRRQSGNRARIVLFGRPKRYFDDFALMVTPAQYLMPEHANVVRLGLPLIRLDTDAVAAAADAWREPLADLPRPLTVLLVGGRTKPFRMDIAVAREMLAQTLHEMPPGGGLYISTSRRTPAVVVKALREQMPAGARLHAFGEAGADNPYMGLLGLGDRFVVTGDSVSMLTEIARLGKPLAIYPLPVAATPGFRLRGWIEHQAALSRVLNWLRAAGLVGWPRDLTALHDLLVARGWATRLGDPPAGEAPPPVDELMPVVERVKMLVNP